jgi:hypothetical protein
MLRHHLAEADAQIARGETTPLTTGQDIDDLVDSL